MPILPAYPPAPPPLRRAAVLPPARAGPVRGRLRAGRPRQPHPHVWHRGHTRRQVGGREGGRGARAWGRQGEAGRARGPGRDVEACKGYHVPPLAVPLACSFMPFPRHPSPVPHPSQVPADHRVQRLRAREQAVVGGPGGARLFFACLPSETGRTVDSQTPVLAALLAATFHARSSAPARLPTLCMRRRTARPQVGGPGGAAAGRGHRRPGPGALRLPRRGAPPAHRQNDRRLWGGWWRRVGLHAMAGGPAPALRTSLPTTPGLLQSPTSPIVPQPPPPPLPSPSPSPQASWDYLGSDGTAITLHTNHSAPRYRVVRGDLAAPNFPASCTDLLPQHERDLLQWCCLIKARPGWLAGCTSGLRGGARAGACATPFLLPFLPCPVPSVFLTLPPETPLSLPPSLPFTLPFPTGRPPGGLLPSRCRLCAAAARLGRRRPGAPAGHARARLGGRLLGQPPPRRVVLLLHLLRGAGEGREGV